MLRKLAVALIAATVFTAPVLAQSTAPAKTDAAPAANAPAASAPTTPKVVAAKPGLKHAKYHKRVAHHVKRVKHAKHVKYATHKLAKKAAHHKVAKATRAHQKAHKRATTYMRAGAATHPAVVTSHKPVKDTVKTTHRVKHVRLAKKSATHARSDAPAAPKSVN